MSYAETQYNTVGIAHGGANPLDIVENVQDIQRLKAQSDHVIVIIHGGTDFCPYPSPRMVKQYRFYIDAGASAVFNHHQHVPSGYEVYKGRPIFYGLANILPGKIVHPRCINGIAVACQIEKHSLQWEMIPLRFNHQLMRIELLDGHELLQFRKEIDEISQFISNDYLLRDKYGEFLDDPKVKASYNLDFNKKSRLLFRLAKKAGLVDCYIRLYKMNKFANNTSNSRVWNLLRCESHRDALGHYFESDIDTQKMV